MQSKARFVLSRKEVFARYGEIRGHADIVSYSYKTNFAVGKVLLDSDCMFSVHSIESLEQLGVPDRIWFFAQAWDREEISRLLRMGVRRFVVDNENDLNVMLGNIGQTKIELLLRMRLKEHTVHTGKHFVYGMYSEKINSLLASLRTNPAISKLGIHFHRKTQNVSEWSIKEELLDTIKQDNWKNIDYVNIGGGLPAEYKNYPSSVLQTIFSRIGQLRQWLNAHGIRMMIEPGRYIAASPIKLEAEIVNIYDNNIVINCSVYNAAMDTFVAHIRLLVEGELDQGGEAFTIKGCTPDSMDIFRYKAYLDRPRIGDKIVFLNAGAYTYSTDFCNLPKLETAVID